MERILLNIQQQSGRLGQQLGVTTTQATGMLTSLYIWVANNHPTGEIKGVDLKTIADTVGWDGDARVLMDALISTECLSKDHVLHWNTVKRGRPRKTTIDHFNIPAFLEDDPRVALAAFRLGLYASTVAGNLVALWGWCCRNTLNGVIGKKDANFLAGPVCGSSIPGDRFIETLKDAGCIEYDDTLGYKIPYSDWFAIGNTAYRQRARWRDQKRHYRAKQKKKPKVRVKTAAVVEVTENPVDPVDPVDLNDVIQMCADRGIPKNESTINRANRRAIDQILPMERALTEQVLNRCKDGNTWKFVIKALRTAKDLGEIAIPKACVSNVMDPVRVAIDALDLGLPAPNPEEFVQLRGWYQKGEPYEGFQGVRDARMPGMTTWAEVIQAAQARSEAAMLAARTSVGVVVTKQPPTQRDQYGRRL